MEKTHYFLGLGVLFFLLFSFVNSNQNSSAAEKLTVVHLPAEIEGLGRQLGFVANLSRLALQKIDNPGVYSFAEELNASSFDLYNSFRIAAAEEKFSVSYQPAQEEKRKLQELKNLRLERFEPSYLALLIPELKKLQQMAANAAASRDASEMVELLTQIERSSRKYLNIAKELMVYQDHL